VTTTNAPLFVSGVNVERVTNPSRLVYYFDSYDSQNPIYNREGNYDPTRARTPRVTNNTSTARFELPEVLPPFPTALPLPTKVGDTYELAGDYFVNGDLYLSGSDQIRVATDQAATLYVNGSLFMLANAGFVIEPGGALRVFVARNTALLGRVDNRGTPHGFQYFGMPGNTTVALDQPDGSFVGSIYAPQATFTWLGGDSATEYAGALAVRNLMLTRPYHFHFDESLARSGPRRGFAASSWTEL
jgi:hypothetical protein